MHYNNYVKDRLLLAEYSTESEEYLDIPAIEIVLIVMIYSL